MKRTEMTKKEKKKEKKEKNSWTHFDQISKFYKSAKNWNFETKLRTHIH